VLAALLLFVPYLQGASWLQPLHPIFFLESFAILAFGCAWFVKGETLGVLKDNGGVVTSKNRETIPTR